jgi:predicted 3-demethylubiquinone-9 3-methyltransferase (glyoxalase superfamily)
MSNVQSRITPFLWFNDNAQDAADFYLSVFKNSRKTGGISGPDGKVLTVSFELDGQSFVALNGGPQNKFTDAVSFVVNCETQEEIDYYWGKLTSGGGQEVQCGWLRDKFGLAWQITPRQIGELVKHPKAFQAMMTMKKLDIAALEKAAKS